MIGSESVLETSCQQHIQSMEVPILGAGTQVRKLLVGAIEEGVLDSESGSEETTNVYSGQTDVIVKLSWAKLEITKSKQPRSPLRGAACFFAPFPIALLSLQWGILALRSVGGF